MSIYFAAPSGGAGDGSAGSPVVGHSGVEGLTLLPGDTVRYAGGVYAGRLDPPASGAAGATTSDRSGYISFVSDDPSDPAIFKDLTSDYTVRATDKSYLRFADLILGGAKYRTVYFDASAASIYGYAFERCRVEHWGASSAVAGIEAIAIAGDGIAYGINTCNDILFSHCKFRGSGNNSSVLPANYNALDVRHGGTGLTIDHCDARGAESNGFACNGIDRLLVQYSISSGNGDQAVGGTYGHGQKHPSQFRNTNSVIRKCLMTMNHAWPLVVDGWEDGVIDQVSCINLGAHHTSNGALVLNGDAYQSKNPDGRFQNLSIRSSLFWGNQGTALGYCYKQDSRDVSSQAIYDEIDMDYNFWAQMHANRGIFGRITAPSTFDEIWGTNGTTHSDLANWLADHPHDQWFTADHGSHPLVEPWSGRITSASSPLKGAGENGLDIGWLQHGEHMPRCNAVSSTRAY